MLAKRSIPTKSSVQLSVANGFTENHREYTENHREILKTKPSVTLRVFSVFLCVILQICFLNRANAQVYPISVTTQLIPPYSVDLVNYAAPGCEQLRVMVTQLNLTQSYSIRLQMDIQLNGKSIIRTSQQYAPPPILMSPGQTLLISGSDLYPYLDPQNMDFVGYSRENYMRTKCLPEGFYTITFTAINYELPYKVLSQGGSMFCYLAKADPPQLNLPFNNASVQALASQFVNFQWLPRNIASPNATQTTTYRLELFEIRPAGRNPNDIVQSTQPIYTSETTLASLNYTIADPHLEIGMHYAWRIRATEGSGLDRIRNNGYSEVYSFTYGGDASNQPGSKVENFKVEAVAPTCAKLTWDPSTDFDGYKTRYRKSGGNFIWYEDETVKNSFDIFKLTPQETYEFQVQGRKGTIWGGFSDSKTIKMPACQDIKCGDPYTAPNITNRKPLDELRPLQEINAGGFYTTVLKATGANGRFSGNGFTVVPLFENRKISCSFQNILVNTDYQLLEGQIILETSWDNNNNIYNANQITEGKDVKVVQGTNGVSIILPDISVPNAQAITLDIENYDLVIETADGDTIRVDVTKQMEDTSTPTLTLQDKDGNLYSVNKETGETVAMGKVGTSNVQLSDSQKKKIAGDRAIVYFEALPGETKYAFDIRKKEYARSNIIMDTYFTLENPGSTPYDIPFKLIPVGASDVVKVRVAVTENGFNEEKIRFITGTGSELAIGEDNKLTLPSGQDNDGIEIYAVYPQKSDPSQYDVLGKLIVISYAVKTSKVVLVPVNGSTLDEVKVKEELDKIYIPIGINWQVTSNENEFETPVDNLNVEGSGLFSMYSPEMRTINSAFKQQCENFDQSAVYLFIINASTKDAKAINGDMPRSKQFGYIFTSGSDKDYHTIAHELAHGIFHLQHTFSTDYKIEEKSTTNLMDYNGGTDLIKHQWDGIHSPGMVIGMFESDEGGEYYNKIYFTPSWQPFVFTGTYKIGDITAQSENSPVGTIRSLYSNDKNDLYEATYVNNSFVDYKNTKGESLKLSIYTTKIEDSETVYLLEYPIALDCTREGYGIKYSDLKELKNNITFTNNKIHHAYTATCKANFNFTGDAKNFYDYCKINIKASQSLNIEKTASAIQTMGEWYNDYKKLVLTANPYEKWVNSPENLNLFYEAIKAYYDKHKDALKVDNPNCPNCPKYPIKGDAYWDNDGRNWVFIDNKWKDLSGEFCEGDCNNEWKQSLTTEQIQLIHKAFYDEEISQRQNHWMQAWIGGINDEFKTNFYRTTQFATVSYLKNEWVEDELGGQKWIPIWGNIQAAALNASVANDDMTFYTKAGVNLALAAVDAAILKSVVQNLVKTGVVTLVKKAAKEELSLLKTFFSQKNVMITASSITVLNMGAQFAGNCYTRGDVGWALKNVDIFDAFADGALATVTMNGSTLYQLFGKSSKVYIYKPIFDKMSKVFVVEFAKVTVDISMADRVVVKQFFNDDIDAYNAFALFVVAMAADNIPVKNITNELIIWSKANVSTFSKGLSAAAKPIFDRMDEIVKTDGFKLFADQQSEVIEQIIQNITSDYYENMKEERLKVQLNITKFNTEKSFEDLIRDSEKLPTNNKIPENLIINLHE